MIIFISGGCKNGKSTLAERCAAALAAGPEPMASGRPMYYVATMIPHDEEDRLRIRRHVEARDGAGFETLECGTDILRSLERADRRGVFLLDSVTALLSNEMFGSEDFDGDCPARVARELLNFANAVGDAIFVSDYIFGDIGPGVDIETDMEAGAGAEPAAETETDAADRNSEAGDEPDANNTDSKSRKMGLYVGMSRETGGESTGAATSDSVADAAPVGGYDSWTETYRRGLALCDRSLAAAADAVVEVCSGNYILHKGELPL